jgi:hypothetical protein
MHATPNGGESSHNLAIQRYAHKKTQMGQDIQSGEMNNGTRMTFSSACHCGLDPQSPDGRKGIDRGLRVKPAMTMHSYYVENGEQVFW